MVIDKDKRAALIEKLKIEHDFSGKKLDREAKKIYKQIQKKRKAEGKMPLKPLKIEINPKKVIRALRIFDLVLFIVSALLQQFYVGAILVWVSIGLAFVLFIMVPIIRNWVGIWVRENPKPRIQELLKPMICPECKNGLMFANNVTSSGPVVHDINFSGTTGSISPSHYYDTNYLVSRCDNCNHKISREIDNLEYYKFEEIVNVPEKVYADIIVKETPQKKTKAEIKSDQKEEIEALKKTYIDNIKD